MALFSRRTEPFCALRLNYAGPHFCLSAVKRRSTGVCAFALVLYLLYGGGGTLRAAMSVVDGWVWVLAFQACVLPCGARCVRARAYGVGAYTTRHFAAWLPADNTACPLLTYRSAITYAHHTAAHCTRGFTPYLNTGPTLPYLVLTLYPHTTRALAPSLSPCNKNFQPILSPSLQA